MTARQWENVPMELPWEGVTAAKACNGRDALREKLSCKAERGNEDRQVGT